MTTSTIVSAFSFSSLGVNSSLSDIEVIFIRLKSFIEEAVKAKLNNIHTTNDIFDFCTDDSYELFDLIDNAAGADQQIVSSYINDLERIISAYKADFSTTNAIDNLISQNYYDDGNAYIALKDNKNWDNVDLNKHITCANSLYNFNIKLLSDHYTSNIDYLNRVKKLFDRIHYHDLLINTFNTILHGEFKDYTGIITHALRTLNEATPSLSDNSEDHERNIEYIASLSETLGRTIQCSRQGSNKPYFNFKLAGWDEIKSTNCEFHQKINSTDSARLPRGKNVRIYFGLQSYNNERVILLAHIGVHL